MDAEKRRDRDRVWGRGRDRTGEYTGENPETLFGEGSGDDAENSGGDRNRNRGGKSGGVGRRNPLEDLMRSTLDQVRSMVDANTIVGTPITTVDGVTLIPITRVSIGFGTGGGSYGKTEPGGFAGGGGAGVKIDPVAFLTVRDGVTRMLPVSAPPLNTVDRIVDAVPDLMTKVENYFDRKKEPEES